MEKLHKGESVFVLVEEALDGMAVVSMNTGGRTLRGVLLDAERRRTDEKIEFDMVSTLSGTVIRESNRHKSLNSDNLKRVLSSTASVRRRSVHMKVAATKDGSRKQRGTGSKSRRGSVKPHRLLDDDRKDEQPPTGIEHTLVSPTTVLLTAGLQEKESETECSNPLFRLPSRLLFYPGEMSSVQISDEIEETSSQVSNDAETKQQRAMLITPNQTAVTRLRQFEQQMIQKELITEQTPQLWLPHPVSVVSCPYYVVGDATYPYSVFYPQSYAGHLTDYRLMAPSDGHLQSWMYVSHDTLTEMAEQPTHANVSSGHDHLQVSAEEYPYGNRDISQRLLDLRVPSVAPQPSVSTPPDSNRSDGEGRETVDVADCACLSPHSQEQTDEASLEQSPKVANVDDCIRKETVMDMKTQEEKPSNKDETPQATEEILRDNWSTAFLSQLDEKGGRTNLKRLESLKKFGKRSNLFRRRGRLGQKREIRASKAKKTSSNTCETLSAREPKALFEPCWTSKQKWAAEKQPKKPAISSSYLHSSFTASGARVKRRHGVPDLFYSARPTSSRSQRLDDDCKPFKINDIVWAKMVDRPWWPAKVLSFIKGEGNSRQTMLSVSVKWLGRPSSYTDVLPSSLVSLFAETFQQHYLPHKTASTYLRAIEEAVRESGFNPFNPGL